MTASVGFHGPSHQQPPTSQAVFTLRPPAKSHHRYPLPSNAFNIPWTLIDHLHPSLYTHATENLQEPFRNANAAKDARRHGESPAGADARRPEQPQRGGTFSSSSSSSPGTPLLAHVTHRNLPLAVRISQGVG